MNVQLFLSTVRFDTRGPGRVEVLLRKVQDLGNGQGQG